MGGSFVYLPCVMVGQGPGTICLRPRGFGFSEGKLKRMEFPAQQIGGILALYTSSHIKVLTGQGQVGRFSLSRSLRGAARWLHIFPCFCEAMIHILSS